MRYFKFDATQVISDYKRNWRVLKQIDEELDYIEEYLKIPLEPNSVGEWELYKQVLIIRRMEYQLYVNMVMRGLSDLPEIESQVLKDWLIERHPTKKIISKNHIKNELELEKIKDIALKKFVDVAMPN